MARASLSASVQRMGRVMRLHDDAERTDAELLRRYVVERHEASFTTLVHRHGRMVHAVCRRMLQQRADVEDATQAVFIILMRQAGSIRNPEIGGWLHGVAVRVCLKLRASTDRRRCETLTDEPFATETSPEQREIAMILDEELAALPGKYRLAMIECDVLERSRSEAAKLLGWPEGTVATRLAKARQLLADKLRQRGVTLSVTALSVMLGSTRFSVAMPRLWDGPTTSAHLLANGVLRTMSISSLIWRSVAGLLLLGTLGTAVLLAPASDTPVSVSDSAVSVNLAPVPTPVPKVWIERDPILLNDWQAGSLAISPDGDALLVGGTSGHSATFDMDTGALKTMDKPTAGFVAVAYGETNDETVRTSERMIVSRFRYQNGTPIVDEQRVLPKTLAVALFPAVVTEGKKELRAERHLIGCDAAVIRLMTKVSTESMGQTETFGIDFTNLDGKPSNGPLTDPYAVPLATDFVGKRVLLQGGQSRKSKLYDVMLLPLGTKSAIGLSGHSAIIVSAAWSKDGGTIATGDAGGTVIVWDTKTYKETKRLNIDKQRICSIDITKDGKRIAVATISNDKAKHSENIYVWDVDNPPKTFTPIVKPTKIDIAFAGVASIKFTPDGQTLAACFCNFNRLKNKQDGGVRIWDLKSRK